MFWRKKTKKIDFLKAYEKVEDLIKNLRRETDKKRRGGWRAFFKYALIFILMIFILAAVISGILFYKFRDVYDLARAGKISLEKSVSAGRDKNFVLMEENSAQAQNSFLKLAAELEAWRENVVFKNLKVGERELNNLDYLIKSAGIVSKALNEAAIIGEQMDKLLGGGFGENFSEFTPTEKQALFKWLYESGPEFNGLKADLDLAALNLEKVRADGLLSPFKTKIDEVKNKFRQASGFLSAAVLASQLIPELGGYPGESTFLVLFQNNDELRPTGGFLGTYGILQTVNGDIIRFDTHDIYHLDMPLEAEKLLRIVPPEPIAKYLNRNWYMRDSNWSPDWPSSAKQIAWFYKKENDLLPPKNQINDFSGDFDGIIGITPDLVVSLLDLTGPITVDGEQFTSDNFTNLLQYKVEQDLAAQNVTSWQRKEIIGKILSELKIRLFNLSYKQWPAAAAKINEAIIRKDVSVFMADEYQENLVKDLGLGGEIKATDNDYLMIVDSNMAALKTDAAMQKSFSYKATKKDDGLYGRLKISYVHTGAKDWRTDDYKSYTRIYVPEGSTLISADGFTYEEARVYDELGKTVIAGFVLVRTGKSTEIDLEYKLPRGLEDKFISGDYSLYLQKQPGNRVKSVTVDVQGVCAIKSYGPSGAKIINDDVWNNNIVWSTDLETDEEFSINFNF